MTALRRPDVVGPAKSLYDALHDLHHRAGWPSLRTLSRETGVSHTTVSKAFSGPALPSWGTLELLVEALGGDPVFFHGLWLAAPLPTHDDGSDSTTAPQIAGRRSELAAVRRHLETGNGLLLVAGEAGIGKTTLVTTAGKEAGSVVLVAIASHSRRRSRCFRSPRRSAQCTRRTAARPSRTRCGNAPITWPVTDQTAAIADHAQSPRRHRPSVVPRTTVCGGPHGSRGASAQARDRLDHRRPPLGRPRQPRPPRADDAHLSRESRRHLASPRSRSPRAPPRLARPRAARDEVHRSGTPVTGGQHLAAASPPSRRH